VKSSDAGWRSNQVEDGAEGINEREALLLHHCGHCCTEIYLVALNSDRNLDGRAHCRL